METGEICRMKKNLLFHAISSLLTSFSNVFEFGDVNFDKQQYDKHFAYGVRRYLLKENDDTIPAARKKIKKLETKNSMIQISLLVIILFILYFFMPDNILSSYGNKN